MDWRSPAARGRGYEVAVTTVDDAGASAAAEHRERAWSFALDVTTPRPVVAAAQVVERSGSLTSGSTRGDPDTGLAHEQPVDVHRRMLEVNAVAHDGTLRRSS